MECVVLVIYLLNGFRSLFLSLSSVSGLFMFQKFKFGCCNVIKSVEQKVFEKIVAEHNAARQIFRLIVPVRKPGDTDTFQWEMAAKMGELSGTGGMEWKANGLEIVRWEKFHRNEKQRAREKHIHWLQLTRMSHLVACYF